MLAVNVISESFITVCILVNELTVIIKPFLELFVVFFILLALLLLPFNFRDHYITVIKVPPIIVLQVPFLVFNPLGLLWSVTIVNFDSVIQCVSDGNTVSLFKVIFLKVIC